jgi:cytochrome c5
MAAGDRPVLLEAAHLGTTQAAIRRAITDYHIAQPSRREQLARQRQRVAQQRVAQQRAAAAATTGPRQQAEAVRQRCQACLAELGFAGLKEYLQRSVRAMGLVGAAALR